MSVLAPPMPAARVSRLESPDWMFTTEVRRELIARARAEIAAGTYLTARKLDVALDRLLDSVLDLPTRAPAA